MAPKNHLAELSNGNICVIHNLRDIFKASPRDNVVEVDGCEFLGCNGILQKQVPERVANITSHIQTTTSHTKTLTEVHI